MYACIYILVLIFSAFVVTIFFFIFFSFMFFIKHINKKFRENNGIDNHKKYKEFIQGNFLVE